MSAPKVLLAFLCVFAWSVYSTADDKTIPGPENKNLLPGVRGYLLTSRNSRDINCIELPSLKETIVSPLNPKANDDPNIHALSGPDREGRIAYIEDHFFVQNEKERRHLLKTIRLDGTEKTELFSRPGDAMWARKGEIGKSIALSPVGGRVAILNKLKDQQMPGALLLEGSVEIWNVEKKTADEGDIKAIDDGLAWFPDGKRLAYVKLVDTNPAWKDQQADFFGDSYHGWTKVPAVFVRDVVAGTESFLHVGFSPVVLSNGQSVLVSNAIRSSWQRVEVDSGKATVVRWRGIASSGAIACPADNIVLSWCLPTEGTQIQYTQNNSPLRGPKLMLSLKLARLNSAEFQTVLPYIDPRQRVSFGLIEGK